MIFLPLKVQLHDFKMTFKVTYGKSKSSPVVGNVPLHAVGVKMEVKIGSRLKIE